MNRRQILALAAMAPLAACVTAREQRRLPATRLYVFGDSFSDIGYGFSDGNGPTAVAYLARQLGSTLSHPKAADWAGKSLCFARGGASTGSPDQRLKALSVAGQAKTFAVMAASGDIAFDPATTLFFVAGGLNDGELTTEQTRAYLRETVSTLKGAGALHIRIARLPEKIPVFSVTAKRLNPMLERLPVELSRELAIDVKLSYWGTYFDDVLAHPAAHGLINITDACAPRGGTGRALVCAEPGRYYYYRPDHPSTAVHRIVGEQLYGELSR